MSNLRDLRKQAKDLGITYEKTTTPDDLEALIAAKLADSMDDASEPAPAPVSIVSPRTGIKKADADKVGEASFFDDISIDPSNLQGDFLNQGERHGRYGILWGKAVAKTKAAKIRMDVVESELSKEHRNKLADAGVRATEKMIADEVNTDKRMGTVRADYVNALEAEGIFKAMAAAFADRVDMLRELGADNRRQMASSHIEMRDKARELVAAG